jgi:hypothetical protein
MIKLLKLLYIVGTSPYLNGIAAKPLYRFCPGHDAQSVSVTRYIPLIRLRELHLMNKPLEPPTWQPVTTLAELDALDKVEIAEGYYDGFADAPEPQPGGNRSRAYWHGWCRGMEDTGRREPPPEHRRLVTDWAARERERAKEPKESIDPETWLANNARLIQTMAGGGSCRIH